MESKIKVVPSHLMCFWNCNWLSVKQLQIIAIALHLFLGGGGFLSLFFSYSSGTKFFKFLSYQTSFEFLKLLVCKGRMYLLEKRKVWRTCDCLCTFIVSMMIVNKIFLCRMFIFLNH